MCATRIDSPLAAALVFLIACANVLSLLVDARCRTEGRSRCAAAAGATTSSPITLFSLTENMLLSFFGGGFAWILAFWGTGLLVAPSDVEEFARLSGNPFGRAFCLTPFFLALAAVILGLASGHSSWENQRPGMSYEKAPSATTLNRSDGRARRFLSDCANCRSVGAGHRSFAPGSAGFCAIAG